MSDDSPKQGIYAIINTVDDRIYIGQSRNANGIEARWRQHRQYLRAGTHPNEGLQTDWTRLGEAAFQFMFLQPCSSPDEFDRAEESWLTEYAAQRYNVSGNARKPNEGTEKSVDARKRLAISKGARPFFCENLATGEIKRYDWTMDAVAEGFDDKGINRCLSGERETYAGCKWYFDPAVEGKPRLVRGTPRTQQPKKVPRSKVVVGTDPQGQEHIFPSISDAARGTGCGRILITRTVNGELKQTNGWLWRYADAGVADAARNADFNVQKRAVILTNMETGVETMHASVSEAAQALKCAKSGLFNVLAGRGNTVMNHRVRYAA